jgi:biopolymer transport protein ExbD
MKMKKAENRSLTQINVTSLVDVCLTLLIFFMATSPFVMQSGIKVSTPSVQKAKANEKADDVKANIYLQNDSLLVLNGEPLAMADFSDSLRALLAASESKQVVISADDDVIHERVIMIMDEAKQCGAKGLSIVKPKAPRASDIKSRKI